MKEVHDGEETDARNEQTKPHERDKFQCRQQHRFPAKTRPRTSVAGGRRSQGAALESAGLHQHPEADCQERQQRPRRRYSQCEHNHRFNTLPRCHDDMRPTARQSVSDYLGCRHCLAVASATTVKLALRPADALGAQIASLSVFWDL